MIKAVIFDMDGLLIDSEPVWFESISAFLKKRGVTYTPALRNKVMGSGHAEGIAILRKEIGLTGDTWELVNEWRDTFFKRFMAKPLLIDGVSGFLGKLDNKKYRLALATGLAPRENVLKILEVLSVKDYFPFIITGDEITKGKPNPDIYLSTASGLMVDPEDCLVFEDSANGVLSGKAAGMTVYGVNKDEAIREKLKEAGADKVFASLEEVNL